MAIKFLNTVQVDTDVLYVDTANDRVGIGTDSPSHSLHVSTSDNLISIFESTDSISEIRIKDSSKYTRLLTVGADFKIMPNDGVEMAVFEGDTGRTLFNGGNVGIGTTSPATRLHVFKQNTTSRTTTTDLISLGSSHQSVGYNGFGTAIVDYRRTYQHTAPHVINRIKFIERGDSGNDWGGAIQFETKTLSSGTAAPVTRMSIDYNGNVGIGTTNPNASLQIGNAVGTSSEKLDVRGNSSANYVASFEQDHSTGYGVLIDTDGTLVSEPVLKIKNASSELFYVGSNGNVGIGTTSPTGRLDVREANVTISTSNSLSDGVRGLKIEGANAAIEFVGSGNDFWLSALASGLGLYDTTNNSYRFFVANNGNVGIGTTSPSEKLHISGGNLLLDSQYGIRFVDGNTRIYTNADSPEDLIIEADQDLILNPDGNIGMGITAPLQPLSIENSVSPLIKIRCTTNGGGAGIEFNDNGTSAATQNGRITYYHSDGASQGGGSSYWLTGQDDQTLVLANNGRVVVQKSGSASEVGYGFYDDVNTGMYRVSADALGFSTGGTRRLDMNSSGVRIGTGSRVTTILDQDNMSSNSNTALATQQSIKAYVDNSVAAIITPAAPSTVTSTIVGETIEIAFNQSATSDIDYYQVWSSDDGGDYGIIGQITSDDFSSTMTVVDTTFVTGGTMSYRVYAVRQGVYSSAATTSKSYTVSALSVTNMTVVNLNTAYYIQYEKPNSRFIDHIEIYMDSQTTQAALNRSNASIVYSGQNYSYMRNVNTSNNFHQFWVEVVTI